MMVSVNLQKVRRMMFRLGAVRNFLGGIRHCRPELRAPRVVKSNGLREGVVCTVRDESIVFHGKSEVLVERRPVINYI